MLPFCLMVFPGSARFSHCLTLGKPGLTMSVMVPHSVALFVMSPQLVSLAPVIFLFPHNTLCSASLVSVSPCCLRVPQDSPSIGFCPSLNICVFSTTAIHPALSPNHLLFSGLSPHLCPPVSCIPESFTKPWQPGNSAPIFSLLSLSPLHLHLPIRSLPISLRLSHVCNLMTLFSHLSSISISPHVSHFLSSVSSPSPSCSVSFLSSMALSPESLSLPISLDGVEGRRVGEVGLLLLGAH